MEIRIASEREPESNTTVSWLTTSAPMALNGMNNESKFDLAKKFPGAVNKNKSRQISWSFNIPGGPLIRSLFRLMENLPLDFSLLCQTGKSLKSFLPKNNFIIVPSFAIVSN